MAEESQRPIRLMNFVSEDQLAESKRTRGERLEDGTAQRDRPLYEILKENKDKRDAEFNERFKHRPPKALDEDETEFLDKWEMTRREYERQVADDEAQQIQSFQAAVAAQSNIVHELKQGAPRPVFQEERPSGKKNPAPRSLGMIIKVKPQAKKARVDAGNAEAASKVGTDKHESSEPAQPLNGEAAKSCEVAQSGLVSYSDESDDNDD
ncbi:PSME3-interacting protein [Neltuma alba]|uniref:PSME3-interacting protein n=1 Tax=Neltuma alba TaxID=207710 RepID=UPI0010A485B2|nr:PSME3-interacting protein [Prosopis alba]